MVGSCCTRATSFTFTLWPASGTSMVCPTLLPLDWRNLSSATAAGAGGVERGAVSRTVRVTDEVPVSQFVSLALSVSAFHRPAGSTATAVSLPPGPVARSPSRAIARGSAAPSGSSLTTSRPVRSRGPAGCPRGPPPGSVT
ncbi:hypothetical protein [Streptomyces violascens]|uniref:hypothetical protein n=1 Tax=Streptomyces violascens TaxID=67381 RepID=UPI0036A9481E